MALSTLRSTVNTTTGHTPGDLFLRGGFATPLRSLRIPVEAVTDEDLDDTIRTCESAIKTAVKNTYDRRHHATSRQLEPGATVFVQQPSGATKQAVVVSATPHDAVIRTEADVEQRRHVDRLAHLLTMSLVRRQLKQPPSPAIWMTWVPPPPRWIALRQNNAGHPSVYEHLSRGWTYDLQKKGEMLESSGSK